MDSNQRFTGIRFTDGDASGCKPISATRRIGAIDHSANGPFFVRRPCSVPLLFPFPEGLSGGIPVLCLLTLQGPTKMRWKRRTDFCNSLYGIVPIAPSQRNCRQASPFYSATPVSRDHHQDADRQALVSPNYSRCSHGCGGGSR